MDVIFVQESGESFSIEVGFFDSFLEVKEKVQKYKGIPVSKQSLFFNGQPLQNDGVIIESDLTQDSRIQLQLTSATPPPPPLPPLPTLQVTPATPPAPPLPPVPTLRVTPATPPPLPLPLLPTLQVIPATPPPPPPPPIKVKLKVELLRVIQRTIIQVTMDLDDTVLQLKEKIYEQWKTVPLDDMTLLLSTPTSIDEMLDHQSLRELRVSNRSKVYLENKKQPPEQVAPLPQAPPPSGGLRLKVSHVRGTEKITVEVKASAKVRGLRKVLEKSHERVLPEDRRYFFIHKESVMHENESYQWHQVKDGDTIEIFNGHIIDHKQ